MTNEELLNQRNRTISALEEVNEAQKVMIELQAKQIDNYKDRITKLELLLNQNVLSLENLQAESKRLVELCTG